MPASWSALPASMSRGAVARGTRARLPRDRLCQPPRRAELGPRRGALAGVAGGPAGLCVAGSVGGTGDTTMGTRHACWPRGHRAFAPHGVRSAAREIRHGGHDALPASRSTPPAFAPHGIQSMVDSVCGAGVTTQGTRCAAASRSNPPEGIWGMTQGMRRAGDSTRWPVFMGRETRHGQPRRPVRRAGLGRRRGEHDALATARGRVALTMACSS